MNHPVVECCMYFMMTCGVMKEKQFVLECIVVFLFFTAIVFTQTNLWTDMHHDRCHKRDYPCVAAVRFSSFSCMCWAGSNSILGLYVAVRICALNLNPYFILLKSSEYNTDYTEFDYV
jgi:hypothetical protein